MLFYFARAGARHPCCRSPWACSSAAAFPTSSTVSRLGHVTDFLDLRFWPAFNLADSFIVVGVAILLVALVSAERQPRLRRTAPKTTG